VVVVVAIVLAAVVRVLLLQAFYVPSASMEDTLRVGDRIVSSHLGTMVGGVRRGDVVVFADPGGWLPAAPEGPGGFQGAVQSALMFVGLLPSDSQQELVKRVIGVAGDRVQCCDALGRIIVNGVALDEPYVSGPTDQVHFDVTVAPEQVFVMGDNRGNSRDSRYHLNMNSGGVPVGNVGGRVVAVIWPLTHLTVLAIPSVLADLPE
jgi:signal peptidase I